MIIGKLLIHILSTIWIARAYRQWTSFLLSGGLFFIFFVFIGLTNLSLYYYSAFDKVAQLFGIELGTNAAFFVSIIFLFVWLKQVTLRLKLQQRSQARLVQSFAVQDWQHRRSISS